MSSATRLALKQRVARKDGLIVPGAFNALSARVIADLGYEAVYLTGAGLTNMHYGLPDLGYIGVREVVEHTACIRDAVELPLIVDIDTGFGNALNVRHTIRHVERAGADAVQIEDQAMPKRCGHFSGKQVVSCAEMVGKIKAAVDARADSNFQIIARTDARATEGFEGAVERAHRYAEAGADILFVEAPESEDEVRQLPRRLEAPQVMNIVVGGKTPALAGEELARLGFGLVLYANAALQGAVLGMQRSLGELKARRRLDEDPAIVIPFQERQRLVDKPLFDALERKYA
ncbi:MAG TPA: isocitrate lyase/PEP mutase family protein [Ramlibacter sp.]|nr:isocitrate lyase/PEP mutase family protein [Ramlibacter sp.]